MIRFALRRLAIVPVAILLANFFGFALAHRARPLPAAHSPFLLAAVEDTTLLPSYRVHLGLLWLRTGACAPGRSCSPL